MKDSRIPQRKQTTSKEDYPLEVGVELQGKREVQSGYPASTGLNDNIVIENREELMEEILGKWNMMQAYEKVKANKGSYGIDGMKVEELEAHLIQNWETIKKSILDGKYKPKPVRRVEIPKPDGGIRLLGIPTVLDRMIQQAILQILTGIYDKEFSPNSYGFRPKKSAHQAILKAKEYIEEGNRWVVDLDLEKFFDKVNHDKLMSVLTRKIKDKRVLKLIRKYLESGIMVSGIKVKSEEGTPQGGPLSPLLGNILLDLFDKELEERGHKFCRYADDCNIYVKSKKAGERVMKSVTKFIEEKLKLKVNIKKSAVDRPQRRKFLGFSFYYQKGKVRIRVHDKSIKKIKDKIKEITSRSAGKSMEWRFEQLDKKIRGWVNYFRIADMKTTAANIDGWMRRRIRACFWKQWKKIKTKQNNLMKLGVNKGKAWEHANTRKSYWRTAGSQILSTTLTNNYLEKIGLTTMTKILSKQ